MLWLFLSYVFLPVAFLLGAYAFYMSRHHGLLKKLGIPGPKPMPIFGTIVGEARQGLYNFHVEAYRKYKSRGVYGGYVGPTPTVCPCDLDTVRDICVKHFDLFPDRSARDAGKPVSDSLLDLKGDKWKQVRSLISPAFTSGRLKRMASMIQVNSGKLVEYLQEHQESNKEVELKNCMEKFTMTNIASTAFGVSINSFKEEENQFTKQANILIEGFSRAAIYSVFLDFIWPFVKRITSAIPSESISFFTSFVNQAMEQRKDEARGPAKRHDFVQLVLEAEEEAESKRKLSISEIQGNAIVFLLAGSDTTAATLSFVAFLLAMNPECLEKIHIEVDEVLRGQAPDYDNVNELTYLDMCVNESLRMYPPGFLLDRICIETTEIRSVTFPKGAIVLVPACGIHMDSDIYPEPERFIPERFTPEAKAARHPYAFMPFGMGPRNCIGLRLALLTVKIALASVLQRFTLRPCDKTVNPPVIDGVRVEAKDGLWVKVEQRTME